MSRPQHLCQSLAELFLTAKRDLTNVEVAKRDAERQDAAHSARSMSRNPFEHAAA
jgi:hypothetical protein